MVIICKIGKLRYLNIILFLFPLFVGSAKERFVNTNIQEMSVSMDLDGDCPFDAEVKYLHVYENHSYR